MPMETGTQMETVAHGCCRPRAAGMMDVLVRRGTCPPSSSGTAQQGKIATIGSSQGGCCCCMEVNRSISTPVPLGRTSDSRLLCEGKVPCRVRDILQMLPKIHLKAWGFQQEWVFRGEGVREQAEQACSHLEPAGLMTHSAGVL